MVFAAALAGGIMILVVLTIRAAFSPTSLNLLRAAADFFDASLFAWVVLGSVAGVLFTIGAAGVNANNLLLAAVLSRPEEFLVWPAAVGGVGGAAIHILRKSSKR